MFSINLYYALNAKCHSEVPDTKVRASPDWRVELVEMHVNGSVLRVWDRGSIICRMLAYYSSPFVPFLFQLCLACGVLLLIALP
jgi:hypothetical protein